MSDASSSEDCPLCRATRIDAASTGELRRCPCGERWLPVLERDHGLTGEPERDLDNLARWLPTILGRGFAPGDGSARDPTTGRPDHVDANSRSLRRAMAALRRLDQLAGAGERVACEVLWYGYVHLGPDTVRLYKGGLVDRLAERFASREQKAQWAAIKSRIVVREGRAAFGQARLDRARDAWAGAVRNGPEPTRAELATRLSRQIDALIEDALAA